MSTAIVIDNGSHTIKGGLAGSFAPQATFPSQIARKVFDQRHTQSFAGNSVTKQLDTSTVFQSSSYSSELQVSRPLWDHENVDWNGVEKLWKYLLYDKPELSKIRSETIADNHKATHHRISTYDDVNLLLSHHLTDSLKYKSKLLELGYEACGADGVYICPTTTLGLYSVGRLTGTVVDSGYKNTFVSSVYEGYALPFNTKILKVGGATIDQCLQHMILRNPKHLEALRLNNNNNVNNNRVNSMDNHESISLEECEMIKKQLCYCSQDYHEEELMHKGSQDPLFNADDYVLPDGAVLSIRNEKYRACELLFRPKIANLKNKDGVIEAVFQSIARSDKLLQKELFRNIVVIGGNTMVHGFAHRLRRGVANYAQASMLVGVKAPPQRTYAAFTGGSVLASQEQMKDVWINKKMYDEIGQESIVIRCL